MRSKLTERLNCLFNMGFCIFILEVIEYNKKHNKD